MCYEAGMSRQIRLEFKNAIYHVMARGDRRESIAKDKGDRKAFEALWKEGVEKTGWQVYAWVLMGNHYHAVVRTPEGNLVDGMRWLQNTWTKRFNARHQRRGHVFGGRYKALLCEDGRYLRRLIDYVHLNPVRAGMITDPKKLESYAWSSLRDYVLPLRERRQWIWVKGGMEEFDLKDSAAGRRKYLIALNESVDWSDRRRAGLADMEAQSLQSTLQRGWYFGTESYREKMLGLLERLQTDGKRKASSGYTGEEQMDHNVAQAQKIVKAGLVTFNLGKKELRDLRKSDVRKVVIASVIREKTTVRLAWIASALEMGVPARVSQTVRALEPRICRERKIRSMRERVVRKVEKS